jgi:outer membrane protein assembly factor BamD (BamD/ComL family)
LTLLGELDLLKRARAALRSGQPRNAIDLLEAHGRERGGSELVAEATLLRVEALAALGERTVASDLASRFVRENPHSALSDRAKSFILAGAPGAP